MQSFWVAGMVIKLGKTEFIDTVCLWFQYTNSSVKTANFIVHALYDFEYVN